MDKPLALSAGPALDGISRIRPDFSEQVTLWNALNYEMVSWRESTAIRFAQWLPGGSPFAFDSHVTSSCFKARFFQLGLISGRRYLLIESL